MELVRNKSKAHARLQGLGNPYLSQGRAPMKWENRVALDLYSKLLFFGENPIRNYWLFLWFGQVSKFILPSCQNIYNNKNCKRLGKKITQAYLGPEGIHLQIGSELDLSISMRIKSCYCHWHSLNGFHLVEDARVSGQS